MSRLRVLAVLPFLLAGCLATMEPPSGPPAPTTLTTASIDIGAAIRIDREQPAREPSILEAPDGALYVAGFWGFARHVEYRGSPQNIAQGPLVWKSTDHGASWRRLSPGLPVEGAISNSDLDLAVDAQGGVYLAALSYYSSPVTPPPTVPVESSTTLTVVVGASRDAGASWKWTRLDQGSQRSHPWVTVDPKGTVHVVWANDAGIQSMQSADRGTTWRAGGRVHPNAGEAGGIVAAPDGTLVVRTTSLSKPLQQTDDGIAISTDAGASWKFHPVPLNRTAATPRGFDSVAFDAEGRLYYTWANEAGILVADRLLDEGRWRVTRVAAEPNGTVAYFPYLRGGPAGEVAVAWFARQGNTVAARVAHVSGFNGTSLTARVGSFVEATGGTNHADYYQVTFLRSGGLAAAVPMATPDLGQWFDFRTAT